MPTAHNWLFGAGAGGGAGVGWLTTIDDSFIGLVGSGIAVDTGGQVFLSGNGTSGSSYGYILKLDPTGTTINWQRQLSNPTALAFNKVTVSSFYGTVMPSGYVFSGGTNETLDLSLDTTTASSYWQYTYGDNSYTQISNDVSCTNFLTAGCGYSVDGTTGADILIYSRGTSSGTANWARTLGDTSTDIGAGVFVDPGTANIYGCGYYTDTSTFDQKGVTFAYDSTGTLLWQSDAFSSPDATKDQGIVYSPSAIYLYTVGTISSFYEKVYIVRRSTGGSFSGSVQISSASDRFLDARITSDDTGNVYICCKIFSSSFGQGVYVAKFNSSLMLQWQRTLFGAAGTLIPSDIKWFDGNFYIGGSQDFGGSADKMFALQLPDDGTGTGTYGPYTYSTATASTSPPSLSIGTPSLTSSTPSFTDNSYGPPLSSSTLTAARTAL